jgi:hypothetical protein
MSEQTAATADRARNCIRCNGIFTARVRLGNGSTQCFSFSCPFCGCLNSVMAAGVMELVVPVRCTCRRINTVVVEPNLGPVMVPESGIRPPDEGRCYERLTMRRSILKCPECAALQFVFGQMKA